MIKLNYAGHLFSYMCNGKYIYMDNIRNKIKYNLHIYIYGQGEKSKVHHVLTLFPRQSNNIFLFIIQLKAGGTVLFAKLIAS